ncbi:unnamed protein product [Effrenium voratum]|nr:unnamed protein product [Effrenium voratum]
MVLEGEAPAAASISRATAAAKSGAPKAKAKPAKPARAAEGKAKAKAKAKEKPRARAAAESPRKRKAPPEEEEASGKRAKGDTGEAKEEIPAEERAYLDCLVEMLSDDKVDELIKKFDATEDGEDSVIDIDEMSAAKRQQFRRTVERMVTKTDRDKAKRQALQTVAKEQERRQAEAEAASETQELRRGSPEPTQPMQPMEPEFEEAVVIDEEKDADMAPAGEAGDPEAASSKPAASGSWPEDLPDVSEDILRSEDTADLEKFLEECQDWFN